MQHIWHYGDAPWELPPLAIHFLERSFNICLDKMSHHGLFTKLMEKHIPVNLLSLLERWFALSETCVKWGQVVSSFVNLLCGVRQGGVLSTYIFAVFIDSIVDKIKSSGLGCYIKWTCMSVFLYADDIILLAPSVTSLQQLLLVCSLDMAINAKKSSCMHEDRSPF